MSTWVMVNSFLICQRRKQLVTFPGTFTDHSGLTTQSSTSIWEKALHFPIMNLFLFPRNPHLSSSPPELLMQTVWGKQQRREPPQPCANLLLQPNGAIPGPWEALGREPRLFFRSHLKQLLYHCFLKSFSSFKAQVKVCFTHWFIQQLRNIFLLITSCMPSIFPRLLVASLWIHPYIFYIQVLPWSGCLKQAPQVRSGLSYQQ